MNISKTKLTGPVSRTRDITSNDKEIILSDKKSTTCRREIVYTTWTNRAEEDKSCDRCWECANWKRRGGWDKSHLSHCFERRGKNRQIFLSIRKRYRWKVNQLFSYQHPYFTYFPALTLKAALCLTIFETQPTIFGISLQKEKIDKETVNVYHILLQLMNCIFYSITCQKTSGAGWLGHKRLANFSSLSLVSEADHLWKLLQHQNLENSVPQIDHHKEKKVREPKQMAYVISPAE